jgi:YesN/AraC family two-component response regulator
MPEMDGFELMAYLSQKYKSIPIIVITAFGTPEIVRDLHKISSFQYMEKPLDINDLEEMIIKALDHGYKGYIKGISVASFLQMIAMEGQTCTLTIKSNDKIGYVYFRDGELIHAEFEGKQGEEACYKIVTWEDVEIQIEKKCTKDNVTIKKSINHLLIEAHRRIDEKVEQKTDDEVSERAVLEKNFATETAGEPVNLPVIESGNGQYMSKENTMNIKLLNSAVEALKEDLGDGLIATDIFDSTEGQSVAGYNPQPKACAMFTRMTSQINTALSESGFPILGKYFMLDLADKRRVVVIPLGDYIWGILTDGKKTPLGLLLNIALPKVVDAFEEAAVG